MTIEELHKDEWYLSRPEVIRQAIDKLNPTQLLRFKDSGKQCFIRSYAEPESGKLEDVTVTVIKTGVGGPMAGTGFEKTEEGWGVFGVPLDDLEPWPQIEEDVTRTEE